ncbi:hypothetical protein HK097_005100 [Rhizophlyctis rosea]|uniref:RING-type domain-containing protein n=1 Tax=Rhizophlyctis rosea TaxID=64517 RepID=A0AAD5SKX7_9FUNG|nr:hypothetical protein HK097_005100 [Rhizophlyctis rosea]
MFGWSLVFTPNNACTRANLLIWAVNVEVILPFGVFGAFAIIYFSLLLVFKYFGDKSWWPFGEDLGWRWAFARWKIITNAERAEEARITLEELVAETAARPRRQEGLKDAELEQLRTFTVPANVSKGGTSWDTDAVVGEVVPANRHRMSADEMCALCLNEYEAGEVVRELGCLHRFHAECVDPWLTGRGRSDGDESYHTSAC